MCVPFLQSHRWYQFQAVSVNGSTGMYKRSTRFRGKFYQSWILRTVCPSRGSTGLNFLVNDWAYLFVCLFVCFFFCRCGSEGPQVNTQNTLLVVPKVQKYEITSQLDFLLCVDWWNSHSVSNGLSRQGIQFPVGPFLESPSNVRAPKAGVFAFKIEVF